MGAWLSVGKSHWSENFGLYPRSENTLSPFP